MTTQKPCQLTMRDFAILRALAAQEGDAETLVSTLLRRKLAAAAVVSPDQIPPTTVTLDSRVSFKVDGGLATTRIIALRGIHHPLGAVLSIDTPWGMALLGQSCGDTVTIESGGGHPINIEVERVDYQPEASERRLRSLDDGHVPEVLLRNVERVDRGRAAEVLAVISQV